MKKVEIQKLKQAGVSNDEIFRIAAGQLGYYGIAFFGHKFESAQRTRRAKRVLNTIWKRILASTKPNYVK
jgi:hypothetical protein